MFPHLAYLLLGVQVPSSAQDLPSAVPRGTCSICLLIFVNVSPENCLSEVDKIQMQPKLQIILISPSLKALRPFVSPSQSHLHGVMPVEETDLDLCILHASMALSLHFSSSLTLSWTWTRSSKSSWEIRHPLVFPARFPHPIPENKASPGLLIWGPPACLVSQEGKLELLKSHLDSTSSHFATLGKYFQLGFS